jgi:hypothetical protein
VHFRAVDRDFGDMIPDFEPDIGKFFQGSPAALTHLFFVLIDAKVMICRKSECQ